MDPENEALSGTRLGFKTTGDSREAPESSTDSIEPSRGRRGRKRRVKTAVTSPDAGDSRSCTRRSMRVLRARVSEAGQTSESTNATSKKNPARLLRGRVRHPASRSKNSPVMQTTIKKSTAKKAPKRTFGPKLSKSKKSKGRSPTRMTQNNPVTTCKPEGEMENSSCGEETGTLKGSCGKEKPRQHMEVKKEEEEENGVKEEPTEVVEHTERRVGDYTEPIRKRGRQPKDDKAPRQPKRRKKPPVQYVRCEMEGCGTVLAHPRYLQHHIKYQHLLKKKYVCDHPSCGRLFRLQKQLLRHAKHHTDQRDYICEYCARAFKSSHNLAVHRMIHTGEKPIQCEICGFTCRQKASLNWHMKKHDAEASYQFSCSICGKKFEKKDSVVAHKAKSHPEVLIAEALAANGAPVISSPTSVPETVPVLTQPDRPSVTQESQEDVGGSLTQLQQVVLPLAPQTQIDVTQGNFLPTHHVVQVAHQQQAPALLHLTTAPPAHLSSSSSNQPQLIQLPTASTVTSMTTVESQSTLLTLTSVTTLTSPQATQWGREAVEVTQMPVEGELWDRMMVGGGHQDVGEIIWESSRERRKEDEGIVWEREGDKQILLHCAEIPGDNII